MKWLDRGIAAVSPRWGAERAFYRSIIELQGRGYDAAKRGRRTEGWITGGTAANAEIGPALSTIRNRARDLARNNPWAAQGLRKLTDKIVGTGIMPRLAAPANEVERRKGAASDWNAFSDNCDPEGRMDFYGVSKLALRTALEAGEGLVRFIPRPASWKLRVPLQLQVLEPDYFDMSRTQPLDNGGAIIQGVEYDADGRRAAYWLFDDHPGDVVMWRKQGLLSRRVPATQVLSLFDVLRSGQAHGVSMFTPVVVRTRDVDDYEDAELVRKKVAACFAAFVKRAGGANATPLNQGATTDAKGRRIEQLAPGLVQYLGLDEDVVFAEPPQSEGYAAYMQTQLRAIAAGIGVTYEQLTGDLSNVNFSSLRAGLIDFYDLVDHWQWLVMVPQLCRPIWNRFAALQAALGRRDPTEPYDAVWSPPLRQMVDPATETRAERDQVRTGALTLPEMVARRGKSLEEHLAEIADANKQLDAAGIVLDSDPRRTSAAGLAQQDQSPAAGDAPGTAKN